MAMRLMTTEELLDVVATPIGGVEYGTVEARLSLWSGIAWTTGWFRFDRDSPVKRHRWFETSLFGDRWTSVGEARLLAAFGGVLWAVDDTQPMVVNWARCASPLRLAPTVVKPSPLAPANERPAIMPRSATTPGDDDDDIRRAQHEGREMIRTFCAARGVGSLNVLGLVDMVAALLHALHRPLTPLAAQRESELAHPEADLHQSAGALVGDVVAGIQRFRERVKSAPDRAAENRLSMNLRGRLDAVHRAAVECDDVQARKELLGLLHFFPPTTPRRSTTRRERKGRPRTS